MVAVAVVGSAGPASSSSRLVFLYVTYSGVRASSCENLHASPLWQPIERKKNQQRLSAFGVRSTGGSSLSFSMSVDRKSRDDLISFGKNTRTRDALPTMLLIQLVLLAGSVFTGFLLYTLIRASRSMRISRSRWSQKRRMCSMRSKQAS